MMTDAAYEILGINSSNEASNIIEQMVTGNDVTSEYTKNN